MLSMTRVAAGASGFFTFTQSTHHPRPVRPVAPLRHDALGAERARVRVNGVAASTDVLGQPDAVGRLAQDFGQRGAADFAWPIAHVGTVHLDDVERVEERCPRTAAPGQCEAQALEIRDAPIITNDAFAVDGGGLDRHREQRLDDRRDLVGPLLAVSSEHAVAVASGDETKAVVLDLVDPERAVRHGARERRQARLDEASGASRRRGARQH
jgi:hypothetical protein